MTNNIYEMIYSAKNILLVFLILQISVSIGQVKEMSLIDTSKSEVNNQKLILKQSTTFPQIHTNLDGLVREFVRTMYQDRNGNYWFGTNGDGIIRYDGRTLEKITIAGLLPNFRVFEIVEDREGNIWFGTSEGLLKYDGLKFETFSLKEGLMHVNAEIWGLTIDKRGNIWVGSTGGVSKFDGMKFIPFSLPESKVENAKPMLSDKLVFKIIEDKNGNMWFATDGNGIFKYGNGEFFHLTTKNGLTDNNVADIFEDKQGNIWIGTFYGGVSKFDGKTYTNFTKDGIIEGEETYNFYEDSHENIWFTAEGFGVYRYDGITFKQFKTGDGLTSNVTLSILEDSKGQVWFGSWQGLSIYDGKSIMNAKDKEPWTK
jgi:ligand-binding sensor domain-containing protein